MGHATTESTAENSYPIDTADLWEPQRLRNGKWACNHPCKDKNACKHLCCREGLDKPPKAPKRKVHNDADSALKPKQGNNKRGLLGQNQTQLSLLTARKGIKNNPPAGPDPFVPQIDLKRDPAIRKPRSMARQPPQLKRLEKLHSATQNGRIITTLPLSGRGRDIRAAETTSVNNDPEPNVFSDHGEDWPTGFSSQPLPESHMPERMDGAIGSGAKEIVTLSDAVAFPTAQSNHELATPYMTDFTMEPSTDELLALPLNTPFAQQAMEFNEPDDMLNEVMVGLADSENLRDDHETVATAESRAKRSAVCFDHSCQQAEAGGPRARQNISDRVTRAASSHNSDSLSPIAETTTRYPRTEFDQSAFHHHQPAAAHPSPIAPR